MASRSVSMLCSNDYTICINNDQNVVSFGCSYSGAHGHQEEYVFPPKIISSLKHIISISTGGYHSVCLDNGGNVFTFGTNRKGQLGIGIEKVKSNTSIPQKVDIPSCIQISCGDTHTICLSKSCKVYSFGENEDGQLGLGYNEDCYYTPQVIKSLKDVEFIECGGNHTFFKTLNNEIYCCGRNTGQLGLGNYDNQYTPILCSSLSNEDVIDIKCSDSHTLVLTSNGDVLSCGNNFSGQLGREINGGFDSSFQKIEYLSEITRIECGYHHSFCVDIRNDLYVFGKNSDGQLGVGDTNNRVKPIKHPSLSNIIDVASKGRYHTFVKASNNEIYSFGYNGCSQLGIETEDEQQLTPIRVFEDIWFSYQKIKN